MKILLTFFLALTLFSGIAQDWKAINQESIRLYREGRFKDAILLADSALEAARKTHGSNSNEYLTSLSNKAYAQSGMGDYLKALNSFRLVVGLCFKLYKLPHVSQLESLNELSKTFVSLGEYDSADYYLNSARLIFNAIPSKNKAHMDTASLSLLDAYIKLNSLDASLRHRKGQVDQAIQLLEEQLTMIKDLYVDNYQCVKDYLTTLNNLSAYYNETPNVEKAKYYALVYYDLILKAHNDLDFIHALQNLGSAYNSLSDLDSANYYWSKALTIIERGTYKESYIHTAVLNNLGTLKLSMEHYDEAIVLLNQSLKIQQSKEAVQPYLFQTTLFNLAECYHWNEQYALADSLYTDLISKLLDDIIHNFTYLSDGEKLAFYKNQLFFIDHYLSFALKISGTIPLQDSKTPYVNRKIPGALFDLQLTTKAIILNASIRMKKSILHSNDTTLISNYIVWEQRKNKLAQALIDGKMDAEELKWLKIKIEENEKWLTANSRSFIKGFQLKQNTWQEVQQSLKRGEAAVEIVRMIDGLVYGALIVTPETKEQPILSLVMSTKSKRLDKQFYQNYYNATVHQLGDSLSYPTYWQPIIDSIRSHMRGHKMPKRVYISNDGIYNQINLNTLFDKRKKKYVIDQTEIVLVTNTKELLVKAPEVNSENKRTAALFGQPQFSIQADSPQRFIDLPGSGKEVALLNETLKAANWQTQLFTSENATEQNLKKLNSNTVLHLASHGYFEPSFDNGSNSLAETMIRSGIALAGVNDPTNMGEDGLLTAFEVSGLNLDGTSLVVLSACETGIGVANHGEGVYGLQRAMQVAGAHYMIMSLWKVDDVATQQLMVNFYKRWMASGEMRKSFGNAQLDLRKQYPNPYYWGAFILSGN